MCLVLAHSCIVLKVPVLKTWLTLPYDAMIAQVCRWPCLPCIFVKKAVHPQCTCSASVSGYLVPLWLLKVSMGPKRGTCDILWPPQGATMWQQVINIHILASLSVAIEKLILPP